MDMVFIRNKIAVRFTGELNNDILSCDLTFDMGEDYRLYIRDEDGIVTKYTCDILSYLGSTYYNGEPTAHYRVNLRDRSTLDGIYPK